jgi:hypothetical protein
VSERSSSCDFIASANNLPALANTIRDALAKGKKTKGKGSWCAMFVYRRDCRAEYWTTYEDANGRRRKVTLDWIKTVAKDWNDGLVLPVWVPEGARSEGLSV